jgi:hypothetical protein
VASSYDDQTFLEIMTIRGRVDRLERVAALMLVRGLTQLEQIRLLALAGFGPTQIAELLVTTANTVSVALTQLRNQKLLPKAKGATRG